YRQFSTYDIADHGRWTTARGADWIEFVQDVGDAGGYAFRYTKRVRLDGDTLVLEHRLKNTGRKPIATTVYDHDFFMLDNQPTGPDFVVRFPFDLTLTTPSAFAGVAEARGRDFVYVRDLQRSAQTEIEGYGPSARDYDFRVENHKTGAAVRQTGDRPLSKINLWSPRTAICPEGFIDLHVDPGKDTTWRIAYEFYELPPARR